MLLALLIVNLLGSFHGLEVPSTDIGTLDMAAEDVRQAPYTRSRSVLDTVLKA